MITAENTGFFFFLQTPQDKSGARKSALNMTAEDAKKKAAEDEVSSLFAETRLFANSRVWKVSRRCE